MTIGSSNNSLGLRIKSQATLIKKIHDGLSIESLEHLSRVLGVSERELAEIAAIPPRTLTRRKKEGRLQSDESDRLVRIALLFDEAKALFDGDTELASKWFRSPKKALGGASPLEYSDTEPGAQEVRDLIGRIEHGVIA